jgi:hypothetical protein
MLSGALLLALTERPAVAAWPERPITAIMPYTLFLTTGTTAAIRRVLGDTALVARLAELGFEPVRAMPASWRPTPPPSSSVGAGSWPPRTSRWSSACRARAASAARDTIGLEQFHADRRRLSG